MDYSIAPRIPPGRVDGQESSKADVSKEPVVVVVVVAVAVIYRCSFIASAFFVAVDSYAAHSCLVTKFSGRHRLDGCQKLGLKNVK